jgi:hypothetical protein
VSVQAEKSDGDGPRLGFVAGRRDYTIAGRGRIRGPARVGRLSAPRAARRDEGDNISPS